MAPRRLDLGGDRVLGYDDVGDPDGTPVVYLHGTPDSRLARHPDDGVAAGLGIRLLAVDRPGFGDSSRRRSAGSLAADLAVLLDDLGLARAALLGWSSGGLAGLTAAAPLGPRCDRLVLVGTLPPVEAYRDEALLAALGPGRRGFAELALDLAPSEAAAEVAPYVVPLPLTPDLARDHVLEGAGETGRRELAAVRGALEQMVEALLHGVGEAAIGLEDDLLDQLEPGLDLGVVACPVRLVHGELDEVSPPAVGHWLAARLPDATVEIVPDAAHHLLFPEWERLLRLAAARQ